MVVRKHGKKFCVESKAGKTLGCHATKKEANKQLRAIEASKHSRSKKK